MSILKNSKIRVSDLDFESIKSSFKEYLSAQAEFADYDFEASGMSILLDTLAYNTYYNSVLANFIANETFLDSAVKRNSVVSHAKSLGYRPKSVKSSRAKVQLILTNAIGEPNQLVMKAGTPFETTVKEQTFQFVTRDDIVATRENGIYNFGEFYIYQGSFNQITYTADGNPAEKFLLPNPNVDSTSIQVVVQTSDTLLDFSYYSLSDTVADIYSDSKVFFIQEGLDGKTEAYFGDGVIGKQLDAGNIVSITYITSEGQVANSAKTFKLTGTIEGNSIVSVSTIEQASGGADAEDIESIRFNAASYFGVQNRAVIAEDYRSLILQNFQNVKNCITWGGEDQVPPEYGKIFVSIQPKNSDFLTDSEKEDVAGIVKLRAVANVTPKFVDPQYIDIELTSNVYYDSLRNNKSSVDLGNTVLEAVGDYGDNYLGNFDNIFRFSQLSRIIDDSDYSILNNNSWFKVFKSFLPVLYEDNIIELNFFNKIKKTTNEYESSFVSSKFNISGLTERVYLKDYLGTLQIVYNDANGAVKVYKKDAGIIDYDSGAIQISPLNITDYDGNEIRFYITPESQDVLSKNNTIVRLQQSNVNINVFVDNTRTE